MKYLYILLTRSGTGISRTIAMLTADRYTHASISFEPSLYPMYSFSRKHVYIPLPAGLRCEPLDRGFFWHYRTIPCALYRLPVSDECYQNAQQMVYDMLAYAAQYRFSILGLMLCRLSIPMHRRHHYFCSEFVAEVLRRSGALQLPKPPSLMRPNDYTQLPHLQCVFEGRLDQLTAQLAASPAFASQPVCPAFARA